MKTQNTKSQPAKNSLGRTTFVEYDKTDELHPYFMTVMQNMDGKRKIAAHIYREYDKENKKWKFTAKDREGKEIFPADFNLFALKKKFIEAAKEKVRAFTQSLAPEKFPQSQEPEKDRVIEQMQRENELKEMRNEKGNDKEKGISR